MTKRRPFAEEIADLQDQVRTLAQTKARLEEKLAMAHREIQFLREGQQTQARNVVRH